MTNVVSHARPVDVTALVLAPAPHVATVEVGAEAVLVDESNGWVHPLNATAAMLWACFDGRSRLDEICFDVSEVLGLPVERVQAETELLARQLLDQRLAVAAGYEPPRPATDPAPVHSCCAVDAYEHVHGARDETGEDGNWSVELPHFCRDTHFQLGPAGEMVARLVAPDGSERLVGLRTNDAAAAAELRDRLAPLLTDEPFRFANISVRLGARQGARTDTNVVFRGRVEALRTFSREQALDAAVAQLHTFLPSADGLVPLHARALERHGTAVLVSDTFGPAIDAEHRRLSAAGCSRLLHTPVLVDPVAGEAVLPRGGDRLAPAVVRVPISHVVAPGRSTNPGPPTAFDVARVKMLISSPARPVRGADLRALAALASTVPIARIDSWEPREVARVLVAL